MSGRRVGNVKLRTPSDARRFLLGVEIEAGELALRICEAMYGVRRPPGISAVEGLAHLEGITPGIQTSALKAAAAATAYFGHCINKAGGIQ